MNGNSIQQSSKVNASRSDLKLTDPFLKTQFIDRAKNIRSPKPRTAHSNLKSRKLANLLEKPKEHSYESQLSKVLRDNSKSAKNLSQKSRNFLTESIKETKQLFSPSNSKSPLKLRGERNAETKFTRENRIKPHINLRDLKKKDMNYSVTQLSSSIDRSRQGKQHP